MRLPVYRGGRLHLQVTPHEPLRYPVRSCESLTLGYRLSATTLTDLSYLWTLVSTVYQGTLFETSYITGPMVTRVTPETIQVTLPPLTE